MIAMCLLQGSEKFSPEPYILYGEKENFEADAARSALQSFNGGKSEHRKNGIGF
jgi:hypothetical protein